MDGCNRRSLSDRNYKNIKKISGKNALNLITDLVLTNSKINKRAFLVKGQPNENLNLWTIGNFYLVEGKEYKIPSNKARARAIAMTLITNRRSANTIIHPTFC